MFSRAGDAFSAAFSDAIHAVRAVLLMTLFSVLNIPLMVKEKTGFSFMPEKSFDHKFFLFS